MIEKVSDIKLADVANYLRVEEWNGSDGDTLETLLKVAKAFVKSYTGRTDEELDEIADFVIVVLILCQDMWDNRTLYVDTTNLNFAVQTILDLHSVNLL